MGPIPVLREAGWLALQLRLPEQRLLETHGFSIPFCLRQRLAAPGSQGLFRMSSCHPVKTQIRSVGQTTLK